MEQMQYEFLDHLKREGLKTATIGDYGRVLRDFFSFVTENYPDVKEITDITRQVVLSYEKSLTVKIDCRGKILSHDRRRKYLSCVVAFFRYLEREGNIYRNPAAMIALPRVKSTIIKDVLTVDEMDILLKTCSGHSVKSLRDRAILELLYSAGIRADELCGIEIADVDFEEKLLFVRKGKLGNERYVPFGESAKYWVKRYMEKVRPLTGADSEVLFVSQSGGRLNPDILCRMIKHWSKRAGIEKNVTTHTFRHSCATHMLKGRADIRYVQKQLGHRYISTTEKYLKIEITDLKEVHERTHPREREDW